MFLQNFIDTYIYIYIFVYICSCEGMFIVTFLHEFIIIFGEGGGREKRGTEEKCARERVCMKDVRLQFIKDTEPTTHHTTRGPKANNMEKCAVLPQS